MTTATVTDAIRYPVGEFTIDRTITPLKLRDVDRANGGSSGQTARRVCRLV